jgi:hypothetical protein
MSGKAMKEYHITTIQSFLADIPAYAAIAWLNFSNILVDVNLPQWEQFLFNHGWLILLALRIVNVIYDFYLKTEYDHTLHPEQDGKQKVGFFRAFVKFLEKFWIK